MKKVGLVVIALLIMFTVVGCNNTKPEDVAARVNGQEITYGQLDKNFQVLKTGYEMTQGKKLDEKKDQQLLESLKSRAFEDLVLQILVREDAQKKGIEISSQEIDQEFETFKSNQGEAEFKKLLGQMGISEQDLRDEIEMGKILTRQKEQITADVNVSAGASQKFYDENLEMFKQPGGMQISHILVETEKEALDILSQLEKGQDFAALAKEKSTCPSAEQGGELGIVNEDSSLVKEFKDAALKLNPGEITLTPVKSEFGYHIIKAGERQEAQTIPFSEVKADIETQLKINQEMEAYNKYLENLRKEADINDYRQK